MPTTPHRKVKSRDLPGLLQTLSCSEDWKEQQEVLHDLCPCRSPRYDKEVWLAIFRAYECAEVGAVRDQAFHAIETLLRRAKTDPRSQDLLSWLAGKGISCLPLEDSIPVWRPRPRTTTTGIPIPRWEPSRRSAANRRR